jgi:hypothetical protein
MRVRLAVAMGCFAAHVLFVQSVVAEPTTTPLTVTQLLADGWEISGYTGLPFEGRTLVLFKHKDRQYLVQCSILYDVSRTKRVAVNCYEVR